MAAGKLDTINVVTPLTGAVSYLPTSATRSALKVDSW